MIKQLLILLLLIPLFGLSESKDSTIWVYNTHAYNIHAYNIHFSRFKQKFSEADSAFINNSYVKPYNFTNDKVITEQLIKKYIEYCYNDSVLVEYLEFKSEDNITTPAVYIPIVKIKKWQHKEPTLCGFSEWLKKQK